ESVSRRQVAISSSPTNAPSLTFVFPISTANNIFPGEDPTEAYALTVRALRVTGLKIERNTFQPEAWRAFPRWASVQRRLSTRFATQDGHRQGRLRFSRGLSTVVNEVRVEPGVRRQLGVEGRGQEIALAGGDDSAVRQRRQRLGRLTNPLDGGCTDEDGVDWPIQAGERQIDLEAVDLPAEGVALDREVHQADSPVGLTADDVACEQDHS